MMETGDILSDFTLEGVNGNGEIGTYTLSELTDDAMAILNVYVYDYSPVCTDQVCDVSELEWLSIHDDVNVVGISGDGPYSHQEFIKDNGIGYPLLCDTSEEIIEELGVLYEEKDGLRRVPKRSIFLIDQNQRVHWKWVSDDNWGEWESGPIEQLSDALSQLRD